MSDKKPLQVALIDDNDIELFLLRKFISVAGVSNNDNVISYNNAQQALYDFEKRSVLPDVLLLDIQMPVMNGFSFLEVFARILKQKKQACCIIMISSTLDYGDISRAEAHPLVSSFVEKPLQPNLLVQILKKEGLI